MASSRAKSKHKKKLLSTSRPTFPASRKGEHASISSRQTRRVIRSHHTLQKQLHQAEGEGKTETATKLKAEIDNAGGLEAYQRASIQGQAADRGGDSSRILMEWLNEASSTDPTFLALKPQTGTRDGSRRLRLLEVGALRPDNTCSRSGLFEVERIDLRSQHPYILQQDFMERPIPADESELEAEGFDAVSLSLVVNYVGDPAARGKMLKRVSGFLRGPRHGLLGQKKGEVESSWFPGLFLVLPAPCVTNSRYLDENRLESIMKSLGFRLRRSKNSTKLVYYYFLYDHNSVFKSTEHFGKREVRKGRTRNNFAIVI